MHPKTILQGDSPWACQILNSMIVLGVLYCVHPFSECPFLLSKLLHLLIGSLLSCNTHVKVFPKGCISTNIKIPWMTLIHNSMIVLGVLYCVHLVLFIFVFTACLFPLSFSLIMLFLCSFIIYYMCFWKLYHHNIFQIYDPLF